MATAPDTLLVTGPVNQQISADAILVTPNGGTQQTMALALAGLNNSGTLTGTLTNAGTISGGVITGPSETFLASDAIATAGSTQATGTQITGQITNVSTTTAGQGVNLRQESAGMLDIVINTGTSGFDAYPVQAGTATINGNAATLGVFVPQGAISVVSSTKAGAVEMGGFLNKKVGYIANTASSAATLAASSLMLGDQMSVINMTGSLGAGAALTLPTVAALLAVTPWGNLNSGTVLRIANSSAGNQAWTLTNNGSFVTAGSSAVAQNTWADFNVIFNNGTSATAQYLGHGTF